MDKRKAIENLQEVLSFLMNGYEGSGYCMCGDKIEYHTIGSGHSPVDSGFYYADECIKGLREAIDFLENCN